MQLHLSSVDNLLPDKRSGTYLLEYIIELFSNCSNCVEFLVNDIKDFTTI